MIDNLFQVIINGQLAKGAAHAQTRQNIATLFKAKIEAVEPMFSGKRISVKKNLDQETAKKYQQLIIKAGLKAGIAPMAAAPISGTGDAVPPKGDVTSVEIADVGSIMDNRPAAPEANIDTSAYGMDEVGTTLDETPLTDEPDIDISAYGMDELGITLDEKPPVAAAEIDTSAISMHETGVDMMEYQPPPKAEYDLSQLSMAEVGETLVEHTPVTPAEIDTSNIEMK